MRRLVLDLVFVWPCQFRNEHERLRPLLDEATHTCAQCIRLSSGTYCPTFASCVLMILIAFHWLACQAEEIEIRGRLIYNVHETNGAVTFSMEKRFICAVSGPLWRVRTWNGGSSADDRNSSAGEFTEMGTDGTDTFLLRFSPGILTNTAPRRGVVGPIVKAPGLGNVHKGMFPYPDLDPHISSVWFAYASHSELDMTAESRLRPIWYVGPEDVFLSETSLRKVSVTRNRQYPHLPEKVSYYRNKSQTSSRAELDGNDDSRHATEADVTEAIFTASDFTPVGNYRVPKRFKLELFSSLDRWKSNRQLFTFASWEGEAQNLETKSHSAGDYRPQISATTIVTDSRNRNREQTRPAQYLSSNVWPNTNDPHFKRSAKTAAELQQLERNKSRSLSSFVRTLFIAGVVLATSVALILWRRKSESEAPG